MKLREVIEALDAEVLVGQDLLDREATTAGAADAVSDVLFFGRPGMLLLTGMTRAPMVRAAEVLELAGVVVVRGKRPDADAVQLAREVEMPLMACPHSLYDACGRLYVRQLSGPLPVPHRPRQPAPGE
jgi:predicted transcriptional regulator